MKPDASTSKVHEAMDAVSLIPDGATVLVDGSGGGVNEPDLLLASIGHRFEQVGSPSNLTVVHVSGMGDGCGGGIDYLARAGLVSACVGGHWGWTQGMQELAQHDEIEAWCLPQGVLSHLLREVAAGRPGVTTHVGLGTFVDPRVEGGALNRSASAAPARVELVRMKGREWLFYPSFPIDVAIIRGSVADTAGNLTMDDEGLLAETLSAAQAARNSGGVVLAQVREIVPVGSLDPRRVRVPGILIDAVVKHPRQRLSRKTDHDPALTGAERVPAGDIPAMPFDERKVIARRAAMEIQRGDVVNLGFGMPDGVAAVLAEEGLVDFVTFTVEQGHVGGIPAGGSDFGMARNQHAMVSADHQFDWYDGGGLDIAVLSFAQVDREGNVNVGKFAGRTPGVGGFINISQGTPKVVFVGTLTTKSRFASNGPLPEYQWDGGTKFVERVEQISFSGAVAVTSGQSITYVTEAAVFELRAHGVTLTEIAPGLTPDDVIEQLGFHPKVSDDLKEMERGLFLNQLLNLQLQTSQDKQ